MLASASVLIDIPELGQLEVEYIHRIGEVQFWIYHEDGNQNHGAMKIKKFIEFTDMVMKMEDDCR